MLALILSIYFAFTLFIAGVSKFNDLPYFRSTLSLNRLLPAQTIPLISKFIAGFEVILAFALILRLAPIETAATNLLMFICFIVYKLFIFIRKMPPECGCFGATYKGKIDKISITVSSIQIGLAFIYLLLVRNEMQVSETVHLAVSIIFLGFAVWVIVRVLRRHQFRPQTT